MRYMQLRVTEKEFVQIKKAALDANKRTEDFLKLAVFHYIAQIKIKEISSSITKETKV